MTEPGLVERELIRHEHVDFETESFAGPAWWDDAAEDEYQQIRLSACFYRGAVLEGPRDDFARLHSHCVEDYFFWGVHYSAVRTRAWRDVYAVSDVCLLYTSPSPRDQRGSRMPSSA